MEDLSAKDLFSFSFFIFCISRTFTAKNFVSWSQLLLLSSQKSTNEFFLLLLFATKDIFSHTVTSFFEIFVFLLVRSDVEIYLKSNLIGMTTWDWHFLSFEKVLLLKRLCRGWNCNPFCHFLLFWWISQTKFFFRAIDLYFSLAKDSYMSCARAADNVFP